MGKIAAELHQALDRRAAAGEPGRATAVPLARGEGWSVADVVCTSGPSDRPFEELHSEVSIGVVVSGSFGYHTPRGRAVMTAGSILLGNPGECFECGHEHASGDRCVAFHYAPDYFDRIAADAGVPRGSRRFRIVRVPPVRGSSRLVVPASTGLLEPTKMSWEEAAIVVAGATARLAAGLPNTRSEAPAAAVARVTGSVRRIESDPGARWTLQQLAADACQSPFHFLRGFTQVTGVTPHQFVLRARLREAAARLARQEEEEKVIEIALHSGFADISNFNRSFRREFGLAPQAYRDLSRRR